MIKYGQEWGLNNKFSFHSCSFRWVTKIILGWLRQWVQLPLGLLFPIVELTHLLKGCSKKLSDKAPFITTRVLANDKKSIVAAGLLSQLLLLLRSHVSQTIGTKTVTSHNSGLSLIDISLYENNVVIT